MSFIPQWVDGEITKKENVNDAELNEMRGYAAELAMLREFFANWEALHALPPADKRNPLNRKKHEEAAQMLVDSANVIRNYRKGTSGLVLPISGVSPNG